MCNEWNQTESRIRFDIYWDRFGNMDINFLLFGKT